jgi:hypothetical protein
VLLAAVQQVREQQGDVERLWRKLYGRERNLIASSIARMNVFLHCIEDFQTARGDPLRSPALVDGDRFAVFDCVISTPPLSDWGYPPDPFAVHRMLLKYESVRAVAHPCGACPRGDAIAAQAPCGAQTPTEQIASRAHRWRRFAGAAAA